MHAMLGTIFRNIHSTYASTGAASTAGRNAAEEVTMRLESRVEHLELACAGLWELLKQRHGYTDDELIGAIVEVDARDGAADGKIGPTHRICPHCKRRLLSRDSPKCSWCGGDLPTNLF